MRIPPAPVEYPPEIPLPPNAALCKPGDALPLSSSVILIEPIHPQTGEVFEAIELFIHDLRRERTSLIIGLHLTGWYAGVAYAELWSVDFLLYHPPTMQRWWGILPEDHHIPSIIGWTPTPPWRLLGKTYRPSLAQIAVLNELLFTLQSRRHALSHFQPEQSTLLRTFAESELYLHRTQGERRRFLTS
ncbi:MAG: hypothetical protein NZ580_05865 [Bacteroidia bacterium]|nr:hypothetical protein [Bacteroidia bacterium]MDW8236574.1 hypothetical protein [Bacteroidia bacterium]